MACRITELVLDARDPELLARFWCEVLGYVELERVGADIEIGPPGVGFGGPLPTIVFNQTDEPKAGKLRLHIDVNATDREQDDELERLLAAGARRVDGDRTRCLRHPLTPGTGPGGDHRRATTRRRGGAPPAGSGSTPTAD